MKLENFQGDALRDAPGQFCSRPVLGIEFALQLQLQTLFQIPRANARRIQGLHHSQGFFSRTAPPPCLR